MAATITQAGLTLLAQLQASGEALAVDTFIYADITLLDPDDTPPITEVMPDEALINHQAALTQMGRVGDDAVVFSNILGSSVGDFYFNWVGLYDTAHSTLVAVSYVARQQKIANTGTTSGNCLTKNFALQYAALASLASVTISPETWMLDYEATHTALQAAIDAHAARADNPHAVTLAQIGGAEKLIGEIIIWPTLNLPANYLECNGAAVSRETYAALFLVISAVYGGGDGSTTFNLPDLRGEFVRGVDHGRGVDTGRVYGSNQSDAFKSHRHQVIPSGGSTEPVGGDYNSTNPGVYGACGDIYTDYSGDSETRPRNVAMVYCIRAL